MNKNIVSALILCTISIALFCQVQHVEGYVANYNLIFFGDTHIGRGKGSDNLTAIQRYQKLIQATNNVSANFMVNLGDLTNGWYYNDTKQVKMYQQYMNVSKASTHVIGNVRGNHDANNSAFAQYVYPYLTLSGRYGNIGFFLLGANERDAQSWLTTGECYYQYQANMLEQFVHSYTYNASQYHFLFMHFQPNSTWPIPAKFAVPQFILKYLSYFSIVFCGHEGGPARAFTLGTTLIIKTAHLGSGTTNTDTYLQAFIEGATMILTVTSINFLNGKQSLLWKGKVW